jgi:hypothetical protein
MRKLRLNPELLAVETFDVGAEGGMRGTVNANATFFCANSIGTCGVDYTCRRHNTCGFHSCGDQCGTYYCTDESCYEACNPNWTAAGYQTCDGNAECGDSRDTTCETQIC